MLIWSQGAFVSALALSLLHSLWQGALLGLLGLALNVRLKRAAPDVRCGAFFLLLLTIFAVWLGTFCCVYEAQTRPSVLSVGMSAGASSHELLTVASADNGVSRAISLLQSISPLLVASWALGVCVLSLQHLGGFMLLQRLYRTETTPCPPDWEACAARLAVRMGIRRKITLRCSPRIDVPFAFGLLKSSILLPLSAMTRLDPAQVEALIAHELAHFARHDVLLNLVQVCMETILFYHPVVRWVSMQIRAAREQHCDDLALEVIGDRVLYARALYSLEEARASIPQLALGAKGDNSDMTNTHLIRRIRRVLGVAGPERRDPWAKGALALGAATIGLLTLLPVHAQQGGGPTSTPPASPTVTSTVTTSMKILLDINGDNFELHSTNLTPDTPITVNGKEGRFGDLSPQQQQRLQMAVKQIPSPDPSDHVMTSTRYILHLGVDKIELSGTDLMPDTPVTVNDKEGRFGDLTPAQQQRLQMAVKQIKEQAADSHATPAKP